MKQSMNSKKMALLGWSGSIFFMILSSIPILFYAYPNYSKIAETFIYAFLGLSFGWVLGTLISPNHDKEKERFSKLSTAISSLIGGYIAGKTDHIINHFLAIENISTDLLVNISVFFSWFFVNSIAMYIWRVDVTKLSRENP